MLTTSSFQPTESASDLWTTPCWTSPTADMAFVHTTNVYAWKDRRLLKKPSFEPHQLFLYANGRLLLEKFDSTTTDTKKSKCSANLCEIFPYIRLGALDDETRKDRAAEEGLTLAYHTLIIPMESNDHHHLPTTTTTLATIGGKNRWREYELALSFDREVKEWMESFARVLSFKEQFDQVLAVYKEKKKARTAAAQLLSGECVGGTGTGGGGESATRRGSMVRDQFEETDRDDPARLWATARGAGDDYAAIWTAFLEHCSAKIENDGGHGRRLIGCLRGV